MGSVSSGVRERLCGSPHVHGKHVFSRSAMIITPNGAGGPESR